MMTRHHNKGAPGDMNTRPDIHSATAASTTARAGRPRVSRLSRAEQLRVAKRAQREREREAGLVLARLRLPAPLAAQVMFAARQPGFAAALSAFLDAETVETSCFPQLKLLCWNRRSPLLSSADAWSLYERNWRFMEPGQLEPAERQLIDRLALRFGAGWPRG